LRSGRGDRRVEFRPLRVRDQAAFQELPHHRTDSLVDHQLGHDQQRQRQQKTRLHLDVL
jgi:hypothetical protein